ncbi:recombinase family protein [Lysobacter sp. D1-1-M9]|uniref:recombinase family protein n=1 Tax=Novilysobacter longmucuonensis TaxID=3098603 RepID=UPI002FC86177
MLEFVAYYRVSTQRQGATGLGLGAQRTAVQAHVLGVRGQIVGEYEEVESGANSGRPKLNEAIRLAKARKAVLVIAKLDRLARNVYFITRLMESGVEFVAADLPHANKLTIHIIAAVAEYEREMIGKRTKAALQSAKAKGIVLGNPNAAKQARSASKFAVEKADRFAESVSPHIAAMSATGSPPLSRIAALLNKQRIETQRGRQWTATGVKNVIARAKRIGCL